MNRLFRFVPVVTVLALAVGCAPPDSSEGEGEGDPDPVCTDATSVPCRDQSFQTLGMTDFVNPRVVEDAVVGDHHEVHVDATAGATPQNLSGTDGWVYGKFTDDGFVKVDIIDDNSFDSLDWDLAFRRFVIRANSGSGGPSCVGVANLGDNDAFDDVDSVPASADFATEEYFNDQCTLIPDGSGLETAPGTLTQNFWKYSIEMCLQMTQNVYLIQLADGHVEALQVFAYYEVNDQQSCDDTGSSNHVGSANVRFRWKQVR